MLQAPYPKPKPKPIKLWDAFLGIVNANVLAALLMSAVQAIAGGADAGFYGTAATVLIPLLMGFIAGATWRKLVLTSGQTALLSFFNFVVGCAAAWFFVKEGVVCLVMASPLVFCLIWGGTALGVSVCRPKTGNKPLAVSVVPVILAAMVWDCASPRQEQTRTVTTSVRVKASAASVYPHMVKFSRIEASPTFLLNHVGLPYPLETTASGTHIGATRVCRFSDGIEIGERITALEPGRRVAFTITEQPVYPEFTNHGHLLTGEMTVRDNGDGTATLSGTSVYALRVHPFWFFGWEADEIIHAVHRRVFSHIAWLSAK